MALPWDPLILMVPVFWAEPSTAFIPTALFPDKEIVPEFDIEPVTARIAVKPSVSADITPLFAPEPLFTSIKIPFSTEEVKAPLLVVPSLEPELLTMVPPSACIATDPVPPLTLIVPLLVAVPLLACIPIEFSPLTSIMLEAKELLAVPEPLICIPTESLPFRIICPRFSIDPAFKAIATKFPESLRIIPLLTPNPELTLIAVLPWV